MNRLTIPGCLLTLLPAAASAAPLDE